VFESALQGLMGAHERQLLHALEMCGVDRQTCRNDSMSPTPAKLLHGSPGDEVNEERL